MRRRTFLATAAATTAVTAALPVLAACTHQTRRPNRSAPAPPPGPDSAPTSFADRPTWPTAQTTDTDAVITAARQIGSSAAQLSQRTSAASTTLGKKGQKLAAVSHPSKSGAAAARAVTTAQRSLQDSSTALAELGRAVEQFIQVATQ